MPPAAGRLSTMIVCPSACSRCGAMMRAATSFEPPAGNGTINLMTWLGYGSALDMVAASSSTAAKPKHRIAGPGIAAIPGSRRRELRHLADDGVAHLCCGHDLAALRLDVGGAQSLRQRGGDGLVDQ